MPDKKISDLPLTAAVHADDTIEKSDHNAAPSQRFTPAQLATFMQTALAELHTISGNINLNADGSADFAAGSAIITNTGQITNGGGANILQPDGSASFASNNAQIDATGNISLGGGQAQILANGSATFANGLTALDAAGNIGVGSSSTVLAVDGSASFAGGAATIAANGTAQFSGGAAKIGIDGLVTLGGNGIIGHLTVLDDTDSPTVDLSGAGSIDVAGFFMVQSTKVVGIQQPAIADAAVLLTDIVTKFNTLLAELRVHGLIAT
jgi:hypothetical protein